MYVRAFTHCVLIRQTLTLQAHCSVPKNSCNFRISFLLATAQHQIVTGVTKKKPLNAWSEILNLLPSRLSIPSPGFWWQEYRSPVVFPISNGGQLHPGATFNRELLTYTLVPVVKHCICVRMVHSDKANVMTRCYVGLWHYDIKKALPG